MKPRGIRRYWLFLKAVAMVQLMRASLRWRGFSRTLDMLTKVECRPASAPVPGQEVGEHPMVWAVRAAARRTLGKRPCLPSALTLVLFLRKDGIPAELRIGVERRPTATLSAHAWVESGGVVVFGGAISPERYRPFSTLPVGDGAPGSGAPGPEDRR